MLHASFWEASLNIEHRCDSIRDLSDIIAKAIDVGAYHVVLRGDDLVCLALYAHQRRQLSQVVDEDPVVGKENQVAVFPLYPRSPDIVIGE